MRSSVWLLTTCSSIIYYAQASGLCCCGCPITPCPLKLSESCVKEPLTSCAEIRQLSRSLPSCTALLTAADAKAEASFYDTRTTTPLYQFIPIPVVPLTTPFPGTILRMTSAVNPAHSVPGVIIYPHADNQSQGALIKPGIGYGLNGPMALPNRLAFILSGLINGFANNVHNFIESLGITAG